MELPEDPEKQNNFLVSRRAREVSQVLADAARVARFSSRARSAAQVSGYVARRGDKLARYIKIASLILIVIIPNIISVLYFGLIASDQYVSEAKFTVASGAIPKMDGIGSVTGMPPMAIFQDSNIIINYIESRALVDLLDREIKIREKYGSDNIDWWSRFNKKKTIEKLLDYWRDHVKATITAPAGIIKLEVRAFNPKEARDIADALIVKCEALVNGLNEKMRRDTISFAEAELKNSGERLKNIRIKIESVRNEEGIINTVEASSSLMKTLTILESELTIARNDYETKKKFIEETSPQLRVLKTKMDTIIRQITNINNKLTKKDNLEINEIDGFDRENALSEKIARFSEIELEEKIAETSYSQASMALEIAKQISQKKMIYLHQITVPALAEETIYPSRKTFILLLFIITIICYILIKFVALFTKDHLDWV